MKTTTKAAKAATATRKAPPPAKAGGSEVSSAAMPEFMRKDAGMGMGNLDQSDYEMPRLKLIQGISEELQVYDGLHAGDFFHTLSEESLGSEIEIVPLYLSKRYVLWRPRPPIDQGGILARADDGVHWNPPNTEFTVKIDKKGNTVKWRTLRTVAESNLASWGTYDPSDPNSQPAATLCYAIVVALPKYPALSPVALLLQRASVKVARKLQGKINISGAPPFGQVFRMSSFVDSGPAGDFNNYRFERDGFVTQPAQYADYKQMSENFERLGVKLRDLESAQDDEAGGGGADEEAARKTTKY